MTETRPTAPYVDGPGVPAHVRADVVATERLLANLSRVLFQVRHHAGKTRDELAVEADVSPSVVKRVETQRDFLPNARTLLKLLRWLCANA